MLLVVVEDEEEEEVEDEGEGVGKRGQTGFRRLPQGPPLATSFAKSAFVGGKCDVCGKTARPPWRARHSQRNPHAKSE